MAASTSVLTVQAPTGVSATLDIYCSQMAKVAEPRVSELDIEHSVDIREESLTTHTRTRTHTHTHTHTHTQILWRH